MMRYDTYLPIGSDCTPAYYLKTRGLRTEAYLTTIYVVQWMIIGWMTSFQDYLHIEPGMEWSAVLGVIISCVSILITKLLPTIKW